jgi:branched-chain amino acid transport system substrate-binding protein
MRRNIRLGAALAAGITVALVAAGCTGRTAEDPDDGASADTSPIVIGASWPQSGPLGSAAPGLIGLQTYIDAVNADGGVNGREIELVTADDAYDPARLVENSREFVERDGAIAVVSFGGISIAGRDYLKQAGVAGIAMAGNSPLSDTDGYPLQRAFWPDITWEGQLQAQWLQETAPDAVVGYIGFNNDLSESQLAGLAAGGIDVAETALVPPGTSDLSAQVSQFQAAGVDTVIITIGAPTMGAAVGYIDQIGWEPTIILGSTTSDRATVVNQAGAEAAEGLYSFQWLKDPADPAFADDEGVVEFTAALEAAGHGDAVDDALAFNGWGLGAAIVSALESTDDDTSEGFISAWDSFSDEANPLLREGITLDSGPFGRVIFQYELSRFDGSGWVAEEAPVDVREVGIVE